MRTDRRFCGKQCRLWWYRHRGVKRPDFSPGGDCLLTPLSKGQPKTLAQALAALAEARAYAAQLEAAARQQQTHEHQLRDELAALAEELNTRRASSLREQHAQRDELAAVKQQLAEAEQREQTALAEVNKVREQATNLDGRLNAVESEATRQKETAERDSAELTELRRERDQLVSKHAHDIDEVKSKAATTAAEHERLVQENAGLLAELRTVKSQRDDLNGQNAELIRGRDELRGRLDVTGKILALREEEMNRQQQNIAAAERAHREAHAVAESESRSLRAEKDRRIAAERRVEQFTRYLEQMAKASQVSTSTDEQVPLFQMRNDLLAAELKEIRLHRDEAVAERELLAARILKLMAPGQYLEHAAAAGYDLTKDPLIRLKREEVLVEHRLALWQEAHKKRRRARRLDPEQTIDEQAYAAALSFRWKHINHPHRRRRPHPKWIAVGFWLDAESERYLLTLTGERIEDMREKMGVG